MIPARRSPADPVISLTAQLVPTALLLASAAWLRGICASLQSRAVPLAAWAALGFLIVASTLVGYSVFLCLSRTVSPVLANSFKYAAPVAGLALLALFLDEAVGWAKPMAALVTLAGVTMIVTDS